MCVGHDAKGLGSGGGEQGERKRLRSPWLLNNYGFSCSLTMHAARRHIRQQADPAERGACENGRQQQNKTQESTRQLPEAPNSIAITICHITEDYPFATNHQLIFYRLQAVQEMKKCTYSAAAIAVHVCRLSLVSSTPIKQGPGDPSLHAFLAGIRLFRTC
jgi:hypothetical protein